MVNAGFCGLHKSIWVKEISGSTFNRSWTWVKNNHHEVESWFGLRKEKEGRGSCRK